MNFTVVWQPITEQQLARIWVDFPADRPAVTTAYWRRTRKSRASPDRTVVASCMWLRSG